MSDERDTNEFLDTVREATGAQSEQELADHVANCPTCQQRMRDTR